MRINSIELSWFRGAADPVSLEPDGKSMVIYGENGSGKSSFVDAIEYVLNEGRISHLAHEYSGKHQEKAVPNTHKPQDRKTGLKIAFKDGSGLETEIKPSGISITSGAVEDMKSWDYRRTVLRQDEVSAFIHNTKGGKYSALLPLLGLHQMELAAENLRQLARTIEQQSKLRETKAVLKEVEATRKVAFAGNSDEKILKNIEDLHAKYCADKPETTAALTLCDEVNGAVEGRLNEFSSDQRRYLALRSIADLQLTAHIELVRAANEKLADSVEPLITEKLQVLRSVGSFADKLFEEGEINCPACGRSVPIDLFQAHVKGEHQRLQEIIETFDARTAAIATLCDTVRSLKTYVNNTELKGWGEEITKGGLSDNLAYLDSLRTEHLRTSCSHTDVNNIEGKLLPLIESAAARSHSAPADVKQLSTDKKTVENARKVIAAHKQIDEVARTDVLLSFVTALENAVREEIKVRSQTVIDEISADIQSMWTTLHPDKSVEDVRLYLPKDADKAIDIGLKFHGVEQESPRLTLSEGNRNSLGLCIFLAMAKREADNDRPLFLDDVTVSLDRNHRGMILNLLEKEFVGRQIIILTHDRDWYTELRQQLDAKHWTFKALLPYETPDVGIRWSHKTTTFDDARAHLKDRPDSAGNDARKIMDVELALIAERLRISLPFLRADKNDKRMAHEFLERLASDGKKCFQKKDASSYVGHANAIGSFEEADRLLLSWGNKASHTFDVVRPEAAKLIDACEKAIEAFRCSSCGKNVWFADAAGSEWLQCQCAQIRWRYGKA